MEKVRYVEKNPRLIDRVNNYFGSGSVTMRSSAKDRRVEGSESVAGDDGFNAWYSHEYQLNEGESVTIEENASPGGSETVRYVVDTELAEAIAKASVNTRATILWWHIRIGTEITGSLRDLVISLGDLSLKDRSHPIDVLGRGQFRISNLPQHAALQLQRALDGKGVKVDIHQRGGCYITLLKPSPTL